MPRKFKPTAIFDKLANSDPAIAQKGVEELEEMLASEDIDDRELKEGLKDKRKPVRRAIAKVLHDADDENLDALLVLTRDGTDEERKMAFWDLESKGRNPRVLQALVAGREDPNEAVRDAALSGLKEVSTFELDPGKPEELLGKSKFGGGPDGLAVDDVPEGYRFIAQFSREDVNLKKFAMAYFFVKDANGAVVLGGGGPRSKPGKKESVPDVFAISLGEGGNVLTPLTPTWVGSPSVPKCDGCGKEMRFLVQLASIEDMKVLPEGKHGSFYLFACPEECRTVSAKCVFQDGKVPGQA